MISPDDIEQVIFIVYSNANLDAFILKWLERPLAWRCAYSRPPEGTRLELARVRESVLKLRAE